MLDVRAPEHAMLIFAATGTVLLRAGATSLRWHPPAVGP